jgi:hypothetical protein
MPKRFEGKVASWTTAVISDWTGMAGAELENPQRSASSLMPSRNHCDWKLVSIGSFV